ncbi:unnamed protein product [Symbiodinium sp. KB8]|nr:unnamed protein product [Symbiodinium sp. KB8]
MNAQAELLRDARGKLEAGIAAGWENDDLAPLLYRMNHSNDTYKAAAKHVKVHAATPKVPKAKSGAGPKAAATKGGKK